MDLRRHLRRVAALGLGLALLLWAQFVPAMDPANPLACHAGLKARIAKAGLSTPHACCPQHAKSTVPLNQHATNPGCQNCCKIQRTPAANQPFLASALGPSLCTVSPCGDRICPPLDFARSVANGQPPPLTHTVFELKTDLRI